MDDAPDFAPDPERAQPIVEGETNSAHSGHRKKSGARGRKIVVVASLAYSLVNFRKALLQAMVAAGHDVVACAPDEDPAVTAALAEWGVRYIRVPMERAGLSPFGDLRTLRALYSLFRAERPDIVLAYTQKPIIYAGIAARLCGTRFFAMISGLGHVFTSGRSPLLPLLRWLVARLYRIATMRADTVFVFNQDDRPEMLRRGMLRRDQKVVRLPGSGVDLERFHATPVAPGAPVFLLVARLLRSKGLEDFAAAARIVRQHCPDAQFQLLGPHDANPARIGESELAAWRDEGLITYLGETRDVRPYLTAATVVVLPSWYREGLPRTLLEAMASGRPLITTDAPGCRETVVPGENGFLVPVRDADALAEAMRRFIDEPALAAWMGGRSRELAQARFSSGAVTALVLDAMGIVAGSRGSRLPDQSMSRLAVAGG